MNTWKTNTFPNTGSPQLMAGCLVIIQNHDLSEKRGIYVNAAVCCVPRTHDDARVKKMKTWTPSLLQIEIVGRGQWKNGQKKEERQDRLQEKAKLWLEWDVKDLWGREGGREDVCGKNVLTKMNGLCSSCEKEQLVVFEENCRL